MSDEWGPWIGWNGGECPVDGGAIVEVVGCDYNGIGDASSYAWYHDGEDDDIIAYRVKKDPVVKVTTHVFERRITGDTYNAQCTYTNGKLTKIHWEADE